MATSSWLRSSAQCSSGSTCMHQNRPGAFTARRRLRRQQANRLRAKVALSFLQAEADSAAELLQATEELLRKLNSNKAAPLPPEGYLSDEDAEARFEVTCDVNGCIITPVAPRTKLTPAPAASIASTAGSMDGMLDIDIHEGDGWKLVLDNSNSSGSPYKAVVGSDSWAIALTVEELQSFVQLLMNLRRSITTLDICGEWGGDREATLEMSHGHVYVQGRAPQKRLSALQDLWRRGRGSGSAGAGAPETAAFELLFSIRSPGQREVEAQFSADVVMRMLEFLDSEQGWLGQTAASDGSYSGQPAVRMA